MRLAIAFLCMSLSLPALAASDAEQARAAYQQGTSAYDLGHYRDALEHFEQAYRLRQVPALLFNIAQCHRMLGELREASRVYHSFIAKDPQNPRIEQARELIAQLEDAMRKEREASNAPPIGMGKETESDAPPRTAEPAVAKAEPAKAEPAAAKIEPAAAKSVPVAAKVASTAAPDASVSESSFRPLPWATAGVAAAALGAGAFFGSESASSRSSLRDELHSGDVAQAMAGDVRSNAQKANALFIAGGVLAAASAAFFLVRF